MADLRVRPALPEDLEELLDGYEAVAAEGIHIGGEAPVDRERRRAAWLETMDPATPGTSFVADVGGEIVGQLGVSEAYGRAEIG
ncbi:MAG TPA: hypothetical protein VHN37_15005, partial [Actinomycetota bacterium]|nr:hypothetical protein [Actinomycetota bacterium]